MEMILLAFSASYLSNCHCLFTLNYHLSMLLFLSVLTAATPLSQNLNFTVFLFFCCSKYSRFLMFSLASSECISDQSH